MEISHKEWQILVERYCRRIEIDSALYPSVCARLTLGKDLYSDSWMLKIDTLPMAIDDEDKQFSVTLILNDKQAESINDLAGKLK